MALFAFKGMGHVLSRFLHAATIQNFTKTQLPLLLVINFVLVGVRVRVMLYVGAEGREKCNFSLMSFSSMLHVYTSSWSI